MIMQTSLSVDEKKKKEKEKQIEKLLISQNTEWLIFGLSDRSAARIIQKRRKSNVNILNLNNICSIKNKIKISIAQTSAALLLVSYENASQCLQCIAIVSIWAVIANNIELLNGSEEINS